jgi:hypothetical protein
VAAIVMVIVLSELRRERTEHARRTLERSFQG